MAAALQVDLLCVNINVYTTATYFQYDFIYPKKHACMFLIPLYAF